MSDSAICFPSQSSLSSQTSHSLKQVSKAEPMQTLLCCYSPVCGRAWGTPGQLSQRHLSPSRPVHHTDSASVHNSIQEIVHGDQQPNPNSWLLLTSGLHSRVASVQICLESDNQKSRTVKHILQNQTTSLRVLPARCGWCMAPHGTAALSNTVVFWQKPLGEKGPRSALRVEGNAEVPLMQLSYTVITGC